jgi:hypothetical protein
MNAPRQRTPALTNLDKACANPARHVHILADDPPVVVKVRRVRVLTDPKTRPAEFVRARGAA